MIRDRALALLRQVATGEVPPERALASFASEPVEALGFATVDHHRALRQGYPEVIFAPGKTPHEAVAIAATLADRGEGFLVTRADAAHRAALAARFRRWR